MLQFRYLLKNCDAIRGSWRNTDKVDIFEIKFVVFTNFEYNAGQRIYEIFKKSGLAIKSWL